jgi:hypothetical protein
VVEWIGSQNNPDWKDHLVDMVGASTRARDTDEVDAGDPLDTDEVDAGDPLDIEYDR